MPCQKRGKIVYKYTNLAAARLIIANGTLRLGRPTEMNDPFDVYIDDLFDTELSKKFQTIEMDLVALLSSDHIKFADNTKRPNH